MLSAVPRVSRLIIGSLAPLALFLTQPTVIASPAAAPAAALDPVEFVTPPNSARPGVYWYFLDGNQDRAAMKTDLESMQRVGLGSVLFLEVDIGVPRGPVPFMSEPWQDNFAHAVKTTERLGMEFILGTGPGWSGSGGPWIAPEDSMQHLVGNAVEVEGPRPFAGKLPVPAPHPSNQFAGLSPELETIRQTWYRDVAVLAYPTPAGAVGEVSDKETKTLRDTKPYTIQKYATRYVPMNGTYRPPGQVPAYDPKQAVDLTDRLRPDGTLDWQIPEGKWTIQRFVARTTGQTTRPAPGAGHGFESDKFSATAYEKQWQNFQERLLTKASPGKSDRGWNRVHLDSWESSSQNWTPLFREEFKARCGYDPQPYFPAFMGKLVGDEETTERFLWDLRKVGQGMVLDNYAETIKRLGRSKGMRFSIEPYDMNPAGDIDLGAVADIPMVEFWHPSPAAYDTLYGCLASISAAHVMGRPEVHAEAFTTSMKDARFEQYPGSMKDQTDWALAIGINGFIFHTFAHQPLGDAYQPGMYFGTYGVNWHRNQTWWDLLPAYHRYITRSSHLLRQGQAVADVLYLTPEGAPHIFLPPADAMDGSGVVRDKKGYSFDGISPRLLVQHATVTNGLITFKNASSYRLLVLPNQKTMTPETLAAIKRLAEAGATIVGNPPVASPSLVGFPACDQQVRRLAASVWGDQPAPGKVTALAIGSGKIYWGGPLSPAAQTMDNLYPGYPDTAAILKELGVPEDFISSNHSLRFIHRRTEREDIYFVANRTAETQQVAATFRVTGRQPALWHPDTGEQRPLREFTAGEKTTTIPLQFAPHEAYFVVFARDNAAAAPRRNFPTYRELAGLNGPWTVDFDPARGGPGTLTFATLSDWSKHPERGVRYYSGKATYRYAFDLPAQSSPDDDLVLDLGDFFEMARVTLNGRELGVVWAQPHHIALKPALRPGRNELQIEIANSWENRLTGDQMPEDKGARTVRWESGLLAGKTYATGRYTFTSLEKIARRPLRVSGLLGPVRLLQRSYQP